MGESRRETSSTGEEVSESWKVNVLEGIREGGLVARMEGKESGGNINARMASISPSGPVGWKDTLPPVANPYAHTPLFAPVSVSHYDRCMMHASDA